MGEIAQNAKWVEFHDGRQGCEAAGKRGNRPTKGDQPTKEDLGHQIEGWSIEIATEIKGSILQPACLSS